MYELLSKLLKGSSVGGYSASSGEVCGAVFLVPLVDGGNFAPLYIPCTAIIAVFLRTRTLTFWIPK